MARARNMSLSLLIEYLPMHQPQSLNLRGPEGFGSQPTFLDRFSTTFFFNPILARLSLDLKASEMSPQIVTVKRNTWAATGLK
jgi:hypothetical protein